MKRPWVLIALFLVGFSGCIDSEIPPLDTGPVNPSSTPSSSDENSVGQDSKPNQDTWNGSAFFLHDYLLSWNETEIAPVRVSTFQSEPFLNRNGTPVQKAGISFALQYPQGPTWEFALSIDSNGNISHSKWTCTSTSPTECGASTDTYAIDLPGLQGSTSLLGGQFQEKDGWVRTSNDCLIFKKEEPPFSNLHSIFTPTWGQVSYCDANALPTEIQQGKMKLQKIPGSAQMHSIPMDAPEIETETPLLETCSFTIEDEAANTISSVPYVAWALENDPFLSQWDRDPLVLPSLGQWPEPDGGSVQSDFRFRGILAFADLENEELHFRTMVKKTTANQVLGNWSEYQNSEEDQIVPIKNFVPQCPETVHLSFQDPISKTIQPHGDMIFKNLAPNLGFGWQGKKIAQEPFLPIKKEYPAADFSSLGRHEPWPMVVSTTYLPAETEGSFVRFTKAGGATMGGDIQYLQRDGWAL